MVVVGVVLMVQGEEEMMVEKEAVIGYCQVLAVDNPLTYPNGFESQDLFLEVLVHPLFFNIEFSKQGPSYWIFSIKSGNVFKNKL